VEYARKTAALSFKTAEKPSGLGRLSGGVEINRAGALTVTRRGLIIDEWGLPDKRRSMEETKSKTFEEVQAKWKKDFEDQQKADDRKYVPEEFQGSFQAMPLSGGLFGMGGLDKVAVCLNCGAMVYPSALDRHSRFHEQMVVQNLE
jgi:hypothetical protein